MKYNTEMVHSSRRLTPQDACKPTNELVAYINMRMQAHSNYTYTQVREKRALLLITQRPSHLRTHYGLLIPMRLLLYELRMV